MPERSKIVRADQLEKRKGWDQPLVDPVAACFLVRKIRSGRSILRDWEFLVTERVAGAEKGQLQAHHGGFMQITDRAKDVIKSGGEWISTIDLENLAVGHPKVAEAAAIGVAHPKWDEHPLLVIVLKKGESATKDDILGFMQGKVAKWWMPDDVVFVDEIPHTATGKIQKITLRQQFKDYRLPG